MNTRVLFLCGVLAIFLCLYTVGCSCLINEKSGKGEGSTGSDDDADDAADDSVDDAVDDTAGGDDDACTGFIVQKRGSTEICTPAGVRVTFSVAECDGTPVPDVTEADFTVINDETGHPFQSEGGSSAFEEALNFDFYTILVLDLSYSIVQNDRLGDELDGAQLFVQSMVENQSANFKHHVAIYVFGSTDESELVQDFTQDEGQLYDIINALRDDPGRGSTNLYGAFATSIDLVMAQGSGEMVARSLVIFTDGTHETGDKERMREYALAKMQETHINSYAIGIQGDYDEQDIKELASSPSNFFMVQNSSDLVAAFQSVSEMLDAWSRSNYVMGVCSPLEGENRSLTIQIKRGDKIGELQIHYSAVGFDLVGCDPAAVAMGEGCSGYEPPGDHAPVISGGYWQAVSGHPDYTHLLIFSVCDEDNDLSGGQIFTWVHGTSIPLFADYQVFWDDFTGGAPSAPDCGNPLQIGGIPVNFSAFHNIDVSCDIEVTDGQEHLSNKLNDVSIHLP